MNMTHNHRKRNKWSGAKKQRISY